MLLRRAVDVAETAAAAGAHEPALGVDLDVSELRQVDDDRPVADGVPGDAVAAAADGDRELVLAREADGGDHVGRPGTADDERRSPVDHPVPDAARLVVPGLAGSDHGPIEPRLQAGDDVVGESELAPVEGVQSLVHEGLLRKGADHPRSTPRGQGG